MELGEGSAGHDAVERRQGAAFERGAEGGGRKPLEGEEQGFHGVAAAVVAVAGPDAGRAGGWRAAGVQPSQSLRVSG